VQTVWYACFVYSCVFTKVVDDMILIEHWNGAKPDMSVFCTFRYKYFKIECGKIKKFTFRITQCIYLKLIVERDRYHLYNETIKCMISSHDMDSVRIFLKYLTNTLLLVLPLI
jgi:hypothetical protein